MDFVVCCFGRVFFLLFLDDYKCWSGGKVATGGVAIYFFEEFIGF